MTSRPNPMYGQGEEKTTEPGPALSSMNAGERSVGGMLPKGGKNLGAYNRNRGISGTRGRGGSRAGRGAGRSALQSTRTIGDRNTASGSGVGGDFSFAEVYKDMYSRRRIRNDNEGNESDIDYDEVHLEHANDGRQSIVDGFRLLLDAAHSAGLSNEDTRSLIDGATDANGFVDNQVVEEGKR